MKKYQIPSFLYRLDVRTYGAGVIKDGRRKVADYYKCDPLTDQQMAAIREAIPSVSFGTAVAKYAPEQVSRVIIIPVGKV